MTMTKFKQGLESIMTTGDLEGYLVKEYLEQLLLKLWNQGESFSGKSPFGNSGWENDLIVSLVTAGAIEGTIELDEQGYINDVHYDKREANKYVSDMIRSIFV